MSKLIPDQEPARIIDLTKERNRRRGRLLPLIVKLVPEAVFGLFDAAERTGKPPEDVVIASIESYAQVSTAIASGQELLMRRTWRLGPFSYTRTRPVKFK